MPSENSNKPVYSNNQNLQCPPVGAWSLGYLQRAQQIQTDHVEIKADRVLAERVCPRVHFHVFCDVLQQASRFQLLRFYILQNKSI